MKRALMLGGLLLVGSAAPSQTAAGWKTLVSRDGHFSVRMPGTVQESFAPSREQGGTVRQYFYKASIPFGNDYVASCWDYTDAPRRTLDVTDLDSAVSAQRGELRQSSASVRKFLLGSVPARELRVRRGDGKTDVFRLYLKGRRLYSISTISDGRADHPDESRAFLDSFRIIE